MPPTIKYTIKSIKKKINEKESKIYWFVIKPKKSVLISKGNSKRETKKIVKNKILKNPQKYEDKVLRRFEIVYRREPKRPGTILVLITHFRITNKLLKKFYYKGKEGPVWFTKKWLNSWGWNKKYILKMSEKLRLNKAKISGIGINRYDREFKDYSSLVKLNKN